MNSSELKGLLTGLIFGDGSIGNGVTKRSFKIKSIQEDFIYDIKGKLDNCTNFQTNVRFTEEHFSGGCLHKDSWELSVKAHPYFAKKYHHFYDDSKHRVASREALGWLTPMGLAYWFMGDGYICLVGKTKGFIRDRRVDICTDRYSKETVERMRKMLKDSFGLDTSIIKRNHTYRIRIQKSSYQHFFDLIHEYLVDSMKYKLYFGYEKRQDWMSDEFWQYQIDCESAIAFAA